jgi:hypothetical protein
MSYATDIIGQYKRPAGYVDRILKGEKPADLPQMQFYVGWFLPDHGQRHHAFQPGKIGIGSDQWHLFTVG